MILIVTIPLITFAVGFISGVCAWKMATNDKITTLKDDAKASIEAQVKDAYEAGYIRAYQDKTRLAAEKRVARNVENAISILA